jgi:hypothetical protein
VPAYESQCSRREVGYLCQAVATASAASS